MWVQKTSAWQINQELGIQPFIFDEFICRGRAHLSQHSTNTPEFPCSGCSNVEAIRLGAHLNHRSPVDWTSALLLLRKNSWDVRRRHELNVRNGWLMLLLMTSGDPKSGIPNCGDRGLVQTCWRNWEELATHPGNRSSKESSWSPYHDILHARSSSTKSWDLVSAQSLASSFIDRKYATTPEPTSSTHLTAIMSNRSRQSTLQGRGIAMCRHVEFRMSTWRISHGWQNGINMALIADSALNSGSCVCVKKIAQHECNLDQIVLQVGPKKPFTLESTESTQHGDGA